MTALAKNKHGSSRWGALGALGALVVLFFLPCWTSPQPDQIATEAPKEEHLPVGM
jgi:hypothetical protein